jgi:hypothetical protein
MHYGQVLVVKPMLLTLVITLQLLILEVKKEEILSLRGRAQRLRVLMGFQGMTQGGKFLMVHTL